jgi:nicotinamide-nucleotide amidase
VKIMAKAGSHSAAEAMIAPLEAEIVQRLDGYVFGRDAESPASAIHALLQARGAMLAVAESCTGGRIAAALTGVPGSSRSFAGGVVAYTNAAKVALLGVALETLERYGAVSEETAREMARGARERFATDIAIATTGIAGPGGGTREKPVGLVWFALDDAAGTARSFRVQTSGEREAVMARATTIALGMLWRHLAQRERIEKP